VADNAKKAAWFKIPAAYPLTLPPRGRATAIIRLGFSHGRSANPVAQFPRSGDDSPSPKGERRGERESFVASQHWRSDGKICKIRDVLAYALKSFIGAFSAFLVQPLIGKYILPWFGGGTSVWTTCMLFFQVLCWVVTLPLIFCSSNSGRAAQVIVHVVLLLSAVLLLSHHARRCLEAAR